MSDPTIAPPRTLYSQAQRDITALRRGMHFLTWGKAASVIAAARTEDDLKSPTPCEWPESLAQLNEQGVTQIPLQADITAVRAFLEAQATERGPHVYSHDKNFRGYRAEAVIRAPGMLKLLNDPRILALVEQYLGCAPTLYSVNAWWSDVPLEPDPNFLQLFHRDFDDWKFCVLFIYLTDVDEESGPHQVIAGSHLEETDGVGIEFSKQCAERYGDRIVSLTGPAGSMFLVNTLAIHRGLTPTKKHRLMAWARYGISGSNTNSFDLEQGPLAYRQCGSILEDTPRARYINRLLVEFNRGPY